MSEWSTGGPAIASQNAWGLMSLLPMPTWSSLRPMTVQPIYLNCQHLTPPLHEPQTSNRVPVNSNWILSIVTMYSLELHSEFLHYLNSFPGNWAIRNLDQRRLTVFPAHLTDHGAVGGGSSLSRQMSSTAYRGPSLLLPRVMLPSLFGLFWLHRGAFLKWPWRMRVYSGSMRMKQINGLIGFALRRSRELSSLHLDDALPEVTTPQSWVV